MTGITFGIDFGTTNSLASYIADEEALSLIDEGTQAPHPSVLWYRPGETVVGHAAKQHLDNLEGSAPSGFVRSPKMSLRRRGPIDVDGRPIDPVDAVTEVLSHLRRDASSNFARRKTSLALDRAVMTIPVDFGGIERRSLRQAARAAGIAVVQFVHEPVAALYAYLRSMPEAERGREIARLEGRSVLVFDWGGGTLDLTLCRIQGGAIMQVRNVGDNGIGGDRFDHRLRNYFRERHAIEHGLEDVTALEHPGMGPRLLNEAETMKKRLSDRETASRSLFIRDYLRTEGAGSTIRLTVTRADLERISADIVAKGLALIDRLLEEAGLSAQDVDLCLATGGMVNMPAIQAGLVERFRGRVPRLRHGDRIIAEGAAWIAHDGLELSLSKPIEVLVADGSGRGSYHPLVPAGHRLPVEKVDPGKIKDNTLFCADPRNGVAVFEFAKPRDIGWVDPGAPRITLCVARLPVDPNATPLVERLECSLQIDQDYIVTVVLRSTAMKEEVRAEFHDLDFGLALPTPNSVDEDEGSAGGGRKRGTSTIVTNERSNVTRRTNIAINLEGGARAHDELWRLVPGDIVKQWRPHHFDNRTPNSSNRQNIECWYYVPCPTCGRSDTIMKLEGPIAACRGRSCEKSLAKLRPQATQ
ncbi:Hsp70 family protein [Methylobacterium sp. D48H]